MAGKDIERILGYCTLAATFVTGAGYVVVGPDHKYAGDKITDAIQLALSVEGIGILSMLTHSYFSRKKQDNSQAPTSEQR